MAQNDIDTKINRGKKIVVLSLVSIGAGVGLYFLGRYVVRKYLREGEEEDSALEKMASTYAKMLNMAFANDNYFEWGTNNPEVSRIINAIPTKKMYAAVQKSYKRLYNTPLNTSLEKELTSEQYNNVVLILSSKA